MARNRTRTAVGGTRVSAVWRLVGLAALLTLDAILIPVALIAGGLYMLVDVAMAVFLNRRASGNGLVMGMLKGTFMWVIDLHKWVAVGRDFPGFIPSRR